MVIGRSLNFIKMRKIIVKNAITPTSANTANTTGKNAT